MAGEATAADVIGGQAEVGQPEGGAAQAPTGEPVSGGQPGGVTAPPAKPGGPTADAREPAPSPAGVEEPHVPWARFRTAQTERTQAMRELASAREEWNRREQELTSQIGELTGGSEQTRQIVDDYRVLCQMLQANPDLTQALMQRSGTGVGGEPGAGIAWPGQPRRPEPTPAAPGLDKVGEAINKLNERLAQQEQAQQEAARTRRNAETDRQLSEACTQFLDARGYDHSFLEDAKEHVLKMASKHPDLEMEDVPFVLGTWFKNTDGKIRSQVNKFLEGKRQDAGLPISPGGAAAPVRTEAPAGANDNMTAQRVEEALRRIGWTN